MTQLQALYGYNPERTPQEELEHVRQLVIEAEDDCRSYEDTLAEIDDEAIYEICSGGYDDTQWLHKREIVKRTPKQIRLAGKQAGDRQICLPREPLESGRSVAKGDAMRDPVYAFGSVMRQMFEERLAESTSSLDKWRRELQELEQALAKDKPNWKQEGF